MHKLSEIFRASGVSGKTGQKMCVPPQMKRVPDPTPTDAFHVVPKSLF